MAIHRYAGLATLAFLAVAALTGVVLCFEEPLDRGQNPDLFRSRAAKQVDTIAAAAALERARPELVVTSLPARTAAGRNLVVTVEARPGGRPLGYEQVFLDGGDGRVAGQRHVAPGWDRAHLVRGIYVLHENLLAGTPGRLLLGTAALAWLLSNLVGLYLTWPSRGPYLKRWGQMFKVSWKAAIPRLFLDLHRASGLWLLPALIVLAFTSTAMNFFDEAVTPAVQHLAPPRPSPFDRPAPAQPAARTLAFPEAMAQTVAQTAHERPGWRPAVLQYVPERNLVGVRITRSGFESYRGLGPVTYWYDGATRRFVYLDDPYSDSGGQKLIRSLFPLHTGQAIGAPGVLLDILLGVATFEMCVTGAYLWLKRRPGRIAARRRAR
jgi:uncharacterized iron-regulated membrane protein